MARDEIVIVCEGCGGSGSVLVMDVWEADGRHKAERAWEDQHPDGASMGDFADYPDQVPWRGFCDDCVPEETGATYHVEHARIRTFERLAVCTADLMEKRWLGDTAWDGVLRNAASTDGRPVRRAQPRLRVT